VADYLLTDSERGPIQIINLKLSSRMYLTLVPIKTCAILAFLYDPDQRHLAWWLKLSLFADTLARDIS
jgi:hypothetical protein